MAGVLLVAMFERKFSLGNRVIMSLFVSLTMTSTQVRSLLKGYVTSYNTVQCTDSSEYMQ